MSIRPFDAVNSFRWIVLGVLVTLAACSSGRVDPDTQPWHEGDSYRWKALGNYDGEQAGFQRLDSSRTDVAFVNTLSQERFLKNRHYVNGSGVAIGDVDGDDWPDLYFARMEGPNALYRNRGGFRFEEITAEAGVGFADQSSTGAALEDVDGDGDLDLLVTTLGGPNALFKNDGAGHFRRAEAGLHAGRGSTTMTLADIDGDGDLDLYVGNYKRIAMRDSLPPQEIRWEEVVRQVGEQEYVVVPKFQNEYRLSTVGNRLMKYEMAEPDRMYLNDGAGRFEAVDMAGPHFRQVDGTPLSEVPRDWALTAQFQDVNGDGAPDLYVCNDFQSPDHFWLGDGQGHFQAVDAQALRKTSNATMAVGFSDLERDGDVDFFLADMLGRTYEERQTQMGLQPPLPQEIGGVDVRSQVSHNTLFINRGDDTYAEIAELSGVAASGWTWASLFVDVDLDGYEDLIAANGHAYNAMDADTQMRFTSRGMSRKVGGRRLLAFPDLDLKNVAFRNRGDLTFEEVQDGWGLGTEADVSHGMATGDLDRDGDLDVVANRLNRSAGIYRNEATAPRVAVRLRGKAPNTQGVGAKIVVHAEGLPVQQEEIVAGGQYVSDSEPIAAFAAAGDSLEIEVQWRSGARSVVRGAPNRLYEIFEPGAANSPSEGSEAATAEAQEPKPARREQPSSPSFRRVSMQEGRAAEPDPEAGSPLFEEVSDRLDHVHTEVRYGDFERQPLMPRRLSQQGPGVAWTDVDEDGDADLIIGAGRTGTLAYYRNDGDGRFTRIHGGDADGTVERDLTGIVTLPRAEGGSWVLVGYSNYERSPNDPADPSKILVYEANGQALQLRDELTFGPSSVGPLALADFDGDDDLDLFAGGRHVPGQYPEAPSSKIFINEGGGQFTPSARYSRVFEEVGMISGVVAADFDRDQDADLVLATEWGPLQYYENRGNGRFVDRTEERGLAAYTGWWNGVAAGDFNNDGRLDLVATNWGWNSKYGRPEGSPQNVTSPKLDHPLRVYYADLDRNGAVDVIEAFYHEGRREYLPFDGLSEFGFAVPYVRRRVRSYERFAQASLPGVFGPPFERAMVKEANTLSHMVFLSRGDELRFEGHVLPFWSQLAPAFAATVADFDGDGNEDVFLSQNFFATHRKTPRQDAGRGLLLRGRGDGQFTPVKGQHSGLKVYGEQRAAPAADFDADGRTDLLVTQNGTTTKLYRNTGAKPGIRVRLAGPSGNASGIGAVLRLRYAEGQAGPARVVTAGSGYWSQHAPVQVLGHGDRRPVAVQVQWLDGSQSEVALKEDQQTVTVGYEEPAS